MDARHQRRVRAAEIEFHHRQAAILNRAADIDPALDVLCPGAADQVGIAFARIGADFLQIGNPVLVIGAGITRPAEEFEVARHLAFNDVAAIVHDRVFRIHGEYGHVVDIGQRLDDRSRCAVIERLFHQVGAVRRFQRCDDHGVFERNAAEVQFHVGHVVSFSQSDVQFL